MPKFIEVSLTLLLVATMASGVVIESAAAHMIDMDTLSATMLTSRGFTSGAIVNFDGSAILGNTAKFVASTAEVANIISSMRNPINFIKANGVVLGGLNYSFVSYDRGILVAETISSGLMVTRLRVKWLIGVYALPFKTFILNRDLARTITTRSPHPTR